VTETQWGRKLSVAKRAAKFRISVNSSRTRKIDYYVVLEREKQGNT